jgi:hypothetical protein
LGFGGAFVSSDEVLEVAAIVEIGEDVGPYLVIGNFPEIDDVGVVDTSEDFDLVIGQLFDILFPQFTQIDQLDREL